MECYLSAGWNAFLQVLPPAAALFAAWCALRLALTRGKMTPVDAAMFPWLLSLLVILELTGILDGQFDAARLLDGVSVSVQLFEDGLKPVALLNIALFVPYGFCSPLAFRRLRRHWGYGLLIGAALSAGVEILQLFVGRYAQLDDVMMNTIGAFLGYALFRAADRLRTARRCSPARCGGA